MNWTEIEHFLRESPLYGVAGILALGCALSIIYRILASMGREMTDEEKGPYTGDDE